MKRFGVSIGSMVLAAAMGCGTTAGDALDAESVAATGQALVDDGDSLEGADPAGDEVADDDGVIDEASEDGECRLGSLRRRVLERYDADGSGTLDDTERAALEDDVEGRPLLGAAVAHRRAIHRAVLRRIKFVYDANDDHVLDETERATLKDDLEARCENRKAMILERYDVDGSGALDDAERAQHRADRRARLQAIRAALLERFDRNEDGELGPRERDAMRAAARARAASIRAELKDRFDVNDDGALDDGEKDALREFLRERIRLEGDTVTPIDEEADGEEV